MFKPKNEFEKFLLTVQDGSISAEDIINTLMETEVFMPIHEKHEIAGLQMSDKAVPLTIKEEETGTDILILFSSPERAKTFVSNFPGYGGGLLADFKWIIEKMGTGYGISINPDSDVGLDLEAGQIQDLTRH